MIVTIYCDGPPDDRHDPYVVEQYERHLVGDQTAWLPLEYWNYKGATGRTAKVSQRYFHGTDPVTHPDPTRDDFRMHLVLACPRCKFRDKRDMGRGADATAVLFATFDRMVEAGKDEIGVRLLAQLLR